MYLFVLIPWKRSQRRATTSEVSRDWQRYFPKVSELTWVTFSSGKTIPIFAFLVLVGVRYRSLSARDLYLTPTSTKNDSNFRLFSASWSQI